MAKRSSKSSPRGKDVNYTIPGLLAVVGIVLVTAMYFARAGADMNAAASTGNLYGSAVSAGQDTQAPSVCEPSRKCEGSKLVIQSADCHQYYSFCTHGCDDTRDSAVCR